jgi:hypothetical protein
LTYKLWNNLNNYSKTELTWSRKSNTILGSVTWWWNNTSKRITICQFIQSLWIWYNRNWLSTKSFLKNKISIALVINFKSLKIHQIRNKPAQTLINNRKDKNNRIRRKDKRISRRFHIITDFAQSTMIKT